MKDGEVRDFGRRDKIGYMFGDLATILPLFLPARF